MWGANILVFKHAIQVIDPWAFNAYRLILATTTLGILAWLESRSKIVERKPYSRVQLLSFSMLTGFVYLLVFVKGISLTTAGNTALIFSSMPMWAALISLVFAKERLPAITWSGLLVTFFGTVLVTTQSSGKISFASEYFVGNLLILAAALTWATGTVLSRSLLNAFSPLRLAFISAMITTPMHLVLIAGDLPANWSVATSGVTLWEIVYSGVFSTGLAYASWHVGVGILGASHAAVYQNVVTLVAVMGGWLFLHERPLWAQIVGGILIVAGLILMRRGRERMPPKETNPEVL
jgi:drug/metabolite transporter (DMT)-like permease